MQSISFLSGIIKPKSWDMSNEYKKFRTRSRQQSSSEGQSFVLPRPAQGKSVLPNQFYLHPDVLRSIVTIQSSFRAFSSKRKTQLIKRLRAKEEGLIVKGLNSLATQGRQPSSAPSLKASCYSTTTYTREANPYSFFVNQVNSIHQKKKMRTHFESEGYEPLDSYQGKSLIQNRLKTLAMKESGNLLSEESIQLTSQKSNEVDNFQIDDKSKNDQFLRLFSQHQLQVLDEQDESLGYFKERRSTLLTGSYPQINETEIAQEGSLLPHSCILFSNLMAQIKHKRRGCFSDEYRIL